ncbi:Rossmann-fold NAD(P)-binding domain-containing protein [Natronoflexus pectinivorans]|uniref:Semialdehyde dehydrogenase family protein n=1 Tax=Natronoflexus pectinivorans TaxID=682526 RepID=A0A4R2GG17_9BACT|nr:oxidoreductase [Natronoflexus pectinivorans]TCO06960.1 semialdehyde dehydrogenase family protein [Natronoflexus pectinivorans]
MINAAIYGANGLTGSELAKILSQHPRVGKLYLAARKAIFDLPNHVSSINLKLGEIQIPSDVDVVFCCLGTTLKKAGSVEKFREVDHQAVLELGNRATQNGVKTMVVISSIGANSKSSNYYIRTKGETDEELLKLNIPSLYIVRPSLIEGKRIEKRFMEKMASMILKPFKIIFIGVLRKYKPIKASSLAHVMAYLAFNGHQNNIIESEEIHNIAQHIENA